MDQHAYQVISQIFVVPQIWIIESPDFPSDPSQPPAQPCSHGNSSLITTDAESRNGGMMCQGPGLDLVRHLMSSEVV